VDNHLPSSVALMNFRRLLEETAPVCVAGSEKQEIPLRSFDSYPLRLDS
jgi:hypothetical protein